MNIFFSDPTVAPKCDANKIPVLRLHHKDLLHAHSRFIAPLLEGIAEVVHVTAMAVLRTLLWPTMCWNSYYTLRTSNAWHTLFYQLRGVGVSLLGLFSVSKANTKAEALFKELKQESPQNDEKPTKSEKPSPSSSQDKATEKLKKDLQEQEAKNEQLSNDFTIATSALRQYKEESDSKICQLEEEIDRQLDLLNRINSTEIEWNEAGNKPMMNGEPCSKQKAILTLLQKNVYYQGRITEVENSLLTASKRAPPLFPSAPPVSPRQGLVNSSRPNNGNHSSSNALDTPSQLSDKSHDNQPPQPQPKEKMTTFCGC
ncbi:hypothetical protein JYU14_02335 [Simkania negevensis]|uniref:Uncharacterized protein n=1 Tax=Simkania negevensis TaxID=83561 RepID=A0ABS3ARC6_9BACT|nr:hypothetical protein [Simkania negevensis]